MGCSLESSVAEELIVGYAARTLDAKSEIAFERHLRSCARCRQLAAQQAAVWSALESWKPCAISLDFDQKLAQQIAQQQHASSGLWMFARWVWRPGIPVAALCALLLGIFLLKDDDVGAPPPQNHASAQIEQQVEHALDDMDMLKQIGVDISADRSGSSRKI